MGIREDIEEAIHAHGAWKVKFRDFLSGKESMDLSEIAHTEACELGMWLEAGGRRLLKPEDYEEACKRHANFHQVAGEVVSRIKQKDFKAARQMIAADGSFDRASHELSTFLRKAALRSPG